MRFWDGVDFFHHQRRIEAEEVITTRAAYRRRTSIKSCQEASFEDDELDIIIITSSISSLLSFTSTITIDSCPSFQINHLSLYKHCFTFDKYHSFIINPTPRNE